MKIRNATQAYVGKSQAELEKIDEAVETKDISEKPAEPAPKEVRDKEKLNEAKMSQTAEAVISVNLRLTPVIDVDDNILCVLYPGIKVSVHDAADAPGWYALTYQGRNCFVKKDYIKIL